MDDATPAGRRESASGEEDAPMTMTKTGPQVSIGLPVYNGEAYLPETLDSLLRQTFTDFELIISDNASTDRTADICREAAARDGRIRYLRNETNLGAAANYNRVVHEARGAYFKWAAHDDLMAPEYLAQCVEVLDADPAVAVCHCRTGIIDGRSNLVGDYDDQLDFRSSLPHERFRGYLFRKAREWNAIFGVMRKEVLVQTPLIGGYVSSDQVLLGELILRGELYQVPERLFFRRDHAQNSWRANPTRAENAAWFDPANRGKAQPPTTWKHLREYSNAIRRAGLSPREQALCHLILAGWLAKRITWPVQQRLRALKASYASS